MGWRLNTDTPEDGIESVLVAYADDELQRGYALAGDLYIRRGREFLSEEEDEPPRPEVFWWMPESEVLQGLPAFGYAQAPAPYPQGACPSALGAEAPDQTP